MVHCLQIRKTLEFYEQLRQRMGVVIVGPSGSGKTTLWKNLKSALAKCGQVVKTYVMNPKAMPRTQVNTRRILFKNFTLYRYTHTLKYIYFSVSEDLSWGENVQFLWNQCVSKF